MRLAAMRVHDWQPLWYNLHVTGSHSVTRQETADKRCEKGNLCIIILFFSISKSTSSSMLLIIQLTALGYMVWKMRWYYE
jgi:hypothetical protein